ncbi:MAG: hypothetical protein E6Q73_04350 [Pseudorhodobacter sp.]|nr:MAG: hypothetical protein E6Q73_04350 [Pseudorhodobacter sp.]
MQLALRALRPEESIGSETHATHDRFFRIEKSKGRIRIDPGDAIVVPAGGANETGVAGPTLMTQAGEMKLPLTLRRWRFFRARQTMALTSCRFSWHARVRPWGLLSVTDALQAGRGPLDVTAFSAPYRFRLSFGSCAEGSLPLHRLTSSEFGRFGRSDGHPERCAAMA